jgi:uncharacterized lipoprotein NlpE involved in copper resistance
MRTRLLLLTLLGCSNQQQCELDRADAVDAAIEDALACDYRADAYEPRDCFRFDERVVRTYIGTFCATAELSCIEADDAIVEACFGRPLDL